LIASASGHDYSYIGFIAVEIQFYAQPDTTYTAQGLHRAWAIYYDYDYDYDYYPYRMVYWYYDPWYFGFYEPYYVYQPWYYRFMNQGFMNQRRRTRIVRMGTTHDSDSVTTPGAKPHHLVVVADQTTYNSCNSQLRTMQLRVVTLPGAAVSGVSVDETFPPVFDSCNSSTVSPSGCSPTEPGGLFQDRSSVGCPFPGNSTCGFAVKDRWRWCFSNGSKVIGTLNKDVRGFNITINGSEHFDDPNHPIFR
jgi:hypothetical protein